MPAAIAELPDSHPLQALNNPEVNQVVAASRSIPEMIDRLKSADPAAYQQLTGKPLLMSRTPIGTLAVSLVAYMSARFGLGWDPGMCELAAGVGLLAGGYAMRYISSEPIWGIFRRPQG